MGLYASFVLLRLLATMRQIDLGAMPVQCRQGSTPCLRSAEFSRRTQEGCSDCRIARIWSLQVPRSVVHRSYPLRLFLALAAVFCFLVGGARADDICEATALRDVPAIGVANSFIRKGGKDEAITQFRVNLRTGRTSYCSHGGYCYPTHVQIGDDLLLALKMTNCKSSTKAYGPDASEPDEIVYEVEVIRSRVPRDQMRREDVKNRLLNMGLCSACADNVAQFYTVQPRSQCGELARSALEGNPESVHVLQEGPSFCTWHYPDRR